MAFDALQEATKGKEYPVIDNFTMAQRFFIGYARLWGQNITPEEEVRLTKVDVHSLGMLRVNPVSYTHLDVYKRQSRGCDLRERRDEGWLLYRVSAGGDWCHGATI